MSAHGEAQVRFTKLEHVSISEQVGRFGNQPDVAVEKGAVDA